MVDTVSKTLELTQDDLNEVKSEFAGLSVALGGVIQPDFVYTPAAGAQLKSHLDTALEAAQRTLTAGIADGSIVQPAIPLRPITDKDVLAQMLADNSDGNVNAETMLGLINDAGGNISILNQVDAQMKQAASPAQTQNVTKMVPVDAIPADVQVRVMRIEEALVNIVATVNADDPNANLPAPGTVDGVFDAQSFASYEKTMDYLKDEAAEATGFSKGMLNDFMLQSAISLKLSSDIVAAKSDPKFTAGDVAELENSLAAVPQLFNDIQFLRDKNALGVVAMKEIPVEVPVDVPVNDVASTLVAESPKVVGGNPAVVNAASTVVASAPVVERTETQEQDRADALKQAEINGAILAVETTLFKLGDQLDDITGKLGGIGKNLTSSVVTPLTQDDLTDGVFGENSQDMAAKAIMLLKTLNGEKNPNGLYTETIGRQLKFAVLTKDDFSMLREQLEIEKVTPAQAQALMAPPPTEIQPLAANADAAQQAAHATALTTYNQQKAEYDALQAETDKLNVLFHSLDVLKENDLLNDEKAKSTTKMNMILDGLASAMDNFAPGFKDALKDFFTNSEFGKMVGGILSMFGININRIWGDKDDKAALENAVDVVGDKFEDSFNKIAKAEGLDPDADFAKIMAQSKADFMDKMDGFVPSTAMKLVLGSTDAGQIKAALENAMDHAASAGNLADARAAFVDRLADIGEGYKNGNGMNIDIPERVADAGNTLDNVITQRPELAAVVASAPAYKATLPAVDAEVIAAGEQRVEIEFERSTEDFEQDPERYSRGRVAEIQNVLYNNADLLGISAVNPALMHDDSDTGAFTDTLNKETCGILEEVWIRANIHELVEAGTEITEENLADITKTPLSSENMDVILTYMHDKGVPQDDIDMFSAKMLELDQDFVSTADGSTQNITVLDQALLWGQLTPNLAQWVPQPIVVAPAVAVVAAKVEPVIESDPLRDQYMAHNKDRIPCDVPVFYKEEGSDSVFALIRVKSDGPMDNDPSNDTFKVLELEDYLNTRSLDNPDHLKALLDNYNWRNPTQEGVENVIDRVLCLEPRPQASVEQSEPVTQVFNTRAEVHPTPESFRDLRLLDEGKADFLLDKLDLANDRPDLMERAARNSQHPLDTFFADAIGLQDGRSRFVFLELEAFGIRHNDFDAVVAMRSGSGVEYRFVDYETDFIKPLSEQRAGGAVDMAENTAPAQGSRRLDDLLRVIERVPGGRIIQGAEGGYVQMSGIVPNGQDSIGITNGLKAVYGRDMTTQVNQQAYANGVSLRYNESSRYENMGPRDNSQSDRQSEFNNKSGSVMSRIPLIGKFFRDKPDEQKNDSDADIKNNIYDINDGQPYDPDAVPMDDLTFESNQNAMGGGR